MLPRALPVLLVLLLAPVLASSGATDDKKKDEKGDRPALNLRASPRFAFSPARILFTAELKGGDDVEDFYCPEIEWEWGDGARSVQESDCDPWKPGTAIDRRYTGRHEYERAGTYRIQVTLSRSGKKLAAQTVDVTVRAGLGDPTMEY